MSHFIRKCKHGTVMGQCRCPGPKTLQVVQCPRDHDDWPEPVKAADVAPTEGPQPPSMPVDPEPAIADYGIGGERKRIVAFLREKARELAPVTKGGSLALVQAAILDAAEWIENGDHLV